MRNLFLRLISLFTIANLLFYSVYPAATVLAQDEYYSQDEEGGDEGGGGDESGGDGGGSDWDAYSEETPEAATQDPEVPQESFDFAQDQQPSVSTQGGPFKAPGLSYILPPEQETPASEALLTEQQQQAAYYDDLLTSEEQDQLVSQAREEYQKQVSQDPIVDQSSQDSAVSAYGEATDTAASGSDQEVAEGRSQADADAQGITNALVATLERGQQVPDDWWQDYGRKLGDLSDGVVDTITSQVREAQERGEQKKAEEAVAEAERRAEQDEREYTEGLAKWKNASQEEKAQIIRDAVGIPPEVPDDQVLSYSYGPLIETGAVKVEGDLDNFNLTTNELLPADQSRILSTEKREEIIQRLTGKPLETIDNLSGIFDTADLRTKITDLQAKMNDINQRLQEQSLTELNRYTLNKEFIGLADKLIGLNQDIAVSTAMYLPTKNEALTRESLGIPNFKSALRDNSPIWISALMDLTRPVREPTGYLEDRIIERTSKIDIEEARNMYPEITEKAREISASIFGDTDKLTETIISELLLDEIEPDKILEKFSEVSGFLEYLSSTNGKITSASPEEILKDWNIYRYNSRGIVYPTKHFESQPGRSVRGKEDNWWKLDVIDSLLRQEKDFKNSIVGQRTDDFRSYLENLADFAIANGADTKIKDNLDKVIDPKIFHTIYELGPKDPWGGNPKNVGLTTSSDNSILIRKGSEKEFVVPAHEMIHRATDISSKDVNFKNALLPQVYPYLDLEAYANFNEGLTHWVTLKGMNLVNEEINLQGYPKQVESVDKMIDSIASNANISREQAEGIIIETVLTSNYTKLPQLVGKENLREQTKNQGVHQNDFFYNVITTIDKMIVNPRALIHARRWEQKENLPNQQLPRNPFAKEVFAQEGDIKNGLATFDLLVKKELAKRTLQETGRLPSVYIDELLKTDILTPEVRENYKGFWMATGGNGVVEVEIKNGSYKVGVSEIPDLDIKIPSFIDVKTGTTIIPVAIHEGSGKVEKVSAIKSRRGIDVYAQDQDKELPKVKLAAFYDENGNGNWDGREKALPWAGIQVSLTKVNQQKTISMLPGWNLITLTALPTTPLAASSLLGQIAKQGGYATTVSKLENGAWKSYVIRGDNSFSGEDFPIEPGEAYFVKNLKRALLTFEGQEFATPVKVDLQDGWNAVGFPKTAGGYTVSTLIDELNTQEAGADAAARWESGLWDSFVKKDESYGENFAIEPNRGYIVRLKKGVELTP